MKLTLIITSLFLSFSVLGAECPLFEAAKLNDIKKVKELLSFGSEINCQATIYQNTPLTIALGYKNYEVAELLLNAGADVNVRMFKDHTSLTKAAVANDLTAVKMLLAVPSIDINAVSEYDASALLIATMKNFTEIAKVLLKRPELRVDQELVYGQTSLMFAAGRNNVEVMSLLIKRGANIHHHSAGTGSPLFAATQTCSFEAVEVLVNLRADYNGSYENTVFMRNAEKCDDKRILKKLVDP